MHSRKEARQHYVDMKAVVGRSSSFIQKEQKHCLVRATLMIDIAGDITIIYVS